MSDLHRNRKVDRVGQINVLVFQLKSAGLDLGDIENVIYQVQQVPTAIVDFGRELLIFVETFVTKPAGRNGLAKADDRI